MVRKRQQLLIDRPTNDSGGTGIAEGHPPEARAVMSQVELFLRAGQPRRALDLLARGKVQSPWATNATGVCLLRLGQADRAVELFRPLVLAGSLFVRPDVPTAWKVNFATALLLTDNLSGCVEVLADIQEEDHPGVQRLRAALREWRGRLSLWERVRWFLGEQPDRRVELDFPPGEL